MKSRNSVAICGAALGLASLPLGWLTIKPNRIVAGTNMYLPDSFGWAGAATIAGLWMVCLFFSFNWHRKWAPVITGAAATFLVLLTFLFIGAATGRLLEGQESFARVSLGGGVWITLAGVYVATFAAVRSLRDYPVWRHLLAWSGPAAITIFLLTGWLDRLSILREFEGYRERFFQELVSHIYLFGVAVGIGTVIGISLGIWSARTVRAEKPIFFAANIAQTIPSLALFGLLIAPLSMLSFRYPVLREFGIRGIGNTPALIALVIYSLLPIIRNTYVSLCRIDPAVLDAGRGMGMSKRQIFRRLEVPLAAPLVLEGVRTASVQSVGLTTVAALIGAGGLGWFVFRGIGQAAPDLIILGAIPIILLALAVDAFMRLLVKLATPKGVKQP